MREPTHRHEAPQVFASRAELKGRSLLLLALFLLLVPVAPAQTPAPEHGGKATPLQLLQAAHTYFDQGDYDSARRYYLQVLPAFSKNADVLRNLAFCYYTMGRAGYAQAARYYARAYEVDPSNQDVADKLATCYMSLKRPAEAAVILKKAAERPDAPAEAWKKVAEAYTEAGDAANTESAYDVYLQRRPGDLMARTQLAVLYGQQKDYDKAQEQLRLVLSSNPNYSPALIGMGRIRAWEGQYDDSLSLYERVLRLNPSNGEAQSGKAFVLLWMGRPEEATPIFAKLHRRYPKDDEVLRGMEAAQAAVEQKKLAQARKSGNVARIEALYRDRLAKNPKDLEALKALVALTADPTRCAESIGFARRALDLAPDDPPMQLTLARSLAICQQYAEAIARYRQYLEIRPKSEDALFDLGEILFRAHRIPEATQTFRDLLQINPNNRDASLGLAQCLAASGNYQEALVRYDEALKAAPDNYDALQGKAYVLYWTEQFAQARAIFESLAAQRPSDPQNQQALEDIAKAEEAARWAALQPAPGSPPKDFVVFYEKRLASYPDDVSAMKGLAYSQAEMNNLPQAIEGYEKVLDKNPDDLDAQRELARLLAQNGQYDKAIPLYQSVVKNHPDDTASVESLARVYVWANRPADALPIYQQLLDKDPSNTGYKIQVARLELQLKDYPAAHDALAAVVSTDPSNREARLALAQLDFTQGRQAESLQNFDQILKQDPKDPDALLGKAQINYYQGDIPGAQAAATEAVEQRPKDFDTLFLLANIEHARGNRHQTRHWLDQAAQINPGNPDVDALKERLRQEAAVTVHTSAGYAREIGPANFVTLAPIGFLPATTAKNLPNEDIRYQTYGTTIGVPLFPHVDSYFSFTSLPTQSPTPSIQGAVAPWSFVSRQVWHVSKYLTLRGGAGASRFGPSDVTRSPRFVGDLSDLADRYGAAALDPLGITNQHVQVPAYKPVGLAGATISPSAKLSLDLDWNHAPAVYYPTPYAMKHRLSQSRYDATLNVFFTSRTELHVNFFYTNLYSDSQEETLSLENTQLAVVAISQACSGATPYEIGTTATTRTCLGGNLVSQVGTIRDWGHGGSVTFIQNVVKNDRFSLDAGYTGTVYGFAGSRRQTFLGFFNPELYQNHQITGRIYGKMFGPVGYDLYGGIGIQQTRSFANVLVTENGQPSSVFELVKGPYKRSSVVRPGFTLKVSPHLTLGITYTHYNSAQVLGPLRGNAVSFTTDWTLY
jgi:tetratricopeptide (TPR) repeat protein